MATDVQIRELCKSKKDFIDVIDSTNKKDALPTQIIKIIESLVKSEGYISYNFECNPVSTKGGNYLADLYILDIKGKTVDGEKETNIFIKCVLPGDKMKLLSMNTVYERECFAYKDLSKIYENLQNKYDVPPNERFHFAKGYEESNFEMIVLENLTKKGFTTAHRMDVISLRFAQLSIEKLAKYHSLSYVLQKYNPDYFENKIKNIYCPMKVGSGEWIEFFKNICKLSCSYLSFDKKKRVEQHIPAMLDKMTSYVTESTVVGSVLGHGDYRANNILMKEVNGEVTEVAPVDYQIISYCCPLNDFFYFTFSATDRQFRKDHLNDLKELYYGTMKRYLRYFDLDVNEFYPKKEFERQFVERMDFGLITSLYVLPFCFVMEDNLPDLSNDEMSSLNFKLDPRVKERINGLVDEFIDWGYL